MALTPGSPFRGINLWGSVMAFLSQAVGTGNTDETNGAGYALAVAPVGTAPTGFTASASGGAVYRQDTVTNGNVAFNTEDYGTLWFEIILNAGAATIFIEGSCDGGTTWTGINCRNIAVATAGFGSSFATTTPGTTLQPTSVLPMMRWRTAGTVTMAVGMKRSSPPNEISAYLNGGAAIPIRENPATGTDRSITATTTSQVLMPANTSRTRLFVKNDSAIVVWVNLGATAVASAGGGNISIAANGGYWEFSGYSGAVNIIAASATAAITAREV